MALLASSALATACAASLPPPKERLATAEAEIGAAEKTGAERVPKAKELLTRVRAQVSRAKIAMRDGKNAEADQLLVRAEADAELAVALTHEGLLEQEVAQAKARLQDEEKKAR